MYVPPKCMCNWYKSRRWCSRWAYKKIAKSFVCLPKNPPIIDSNFPFHTLFEAQWMTRDNKPYLPNEICRIRNFVSWIILCVGYFYIIRGMSSAYWLDACVCGGALYTYKIMWCTHESYCCHCYKMYYIWNCNIVVVVDSDNNPNKWRDNSAKLMSLQFELKESSSHTHTHIYIIIILLVHIIIIKW